MKVYLSVPMIANRDPSRIDIMARAIIDSGNEMTSPWVLDPPESPSSTRVNIFERDRGGVEASDAIVADVSNPSTGVGMELMAAYFQKKKIIAVAKKGSTVSGMVRHMPGRIEVVFESDSELYDELLSALVSVREGTEPI